MNSEMNSQQMKIPAKIDTVAPEKVLTRKSSRVFGYASKFFNRNRNFSISSINLIQARAFPQESELFRRS